MLKYHLVSYRIPCDWEDNLQHGRCGRSLPLPVRPFVCLSVTVLSNRLDRSTLVSRYEHIPYCPRFPRLRLGIMYKHEGWRRDVAVSGVRSMNEVNAHRGPG